MNLKSLLIAFVIAALPAMVISCKGRDEEPKVVERIEYRDQPTASITGLVDVMSGKDRLGIMVFAEGTSHMAITNNDGEFLLSGLKVGEYKIMAARHDLVPQLLAEVEVTAEDIAAAQPFAQIDTVVLSRQAAGASSALGRLSGTVALASQGDVSGVLVVLEGSRQATLTDGNGAFHFPFVEPGTHVLRFSKTGLKTNSVSAFVIAGEEAKLDRVLLETGTSEELGGSGQGAAGAGNIFGTVRVLNTDDTSITDFSIVRVVIEGTTFIATPDSTGRFEIRGLPPSGYMVSATAPGYVLEQKFYVDLSQVAAAEVTLSLLEDNSDMLDLGGLYGRVIVEDGNRSAAGAQIALAGTGFVTYAGLDGNWELIGVPAGTYTLLASLKGYRDVLYEDVEVFGDEPGEVEDILLERDVERPRVVAVSPTDGARDVPIVQPVVATLRFSVPMDTDSVTKAIKLSPEVSHRIMPEGTGAAGAVSFRIEIDAVSNEARANVLSYGTRYRLTVESSATSLEGATMEDSFESSFTTGYALIVSTAPADGDKNVRAIMTEPLRVFFNAPLDTDGVTRDIIRVKPDLSAQPQIYFNKDTRTGWTIMNIQGTFEFDTEYEVSIRRGLQTISGDRVRNVPYRFRFKTRDQKTYDEIYGTQPDPDARSRERDRRP